MERQTSKAETSRQPRETFHPGPPVASESPLLRPIHALQSALGNHVFGQLIQAKLKVSQPGDAYEQEADRVADQVMRMPDPACSEGNSLTEPSPAPARLQRACSTCKEDDEEKGIQRLALEGPRELKPQAKSQVGPHVNDSSPVAAQFNNLSNSGEPLSESTRAYFEPRFGHDFSGVRLHTDADAAASAHAFNAQAYTLGKDIVFGAGHYATTSVGMHVLAHELAHVVQNREAPSTPTLRRSVESDAARIESLLSYNLFDWAITDADAIEALEILSNLPTDLQRDVVRRINLGRLQENLPQTHRPILERILTATGTPPISVQDTVTRIQNLLSYDLFDWAITDSDAREAYRLLMTLSVEEQKRVVRVINYDRLLDNLPDAADRTALAALRTTAMAHETAELATMEGLRVRARGIVDAIKANADAMSLPGPPAAGAFESFLSTEYLTAYCASPSGSTANAAIDQMVLEGGGGFSHYGFGLLRDMAERARSHGLGFIDTPNLLGIPAPGSFTTTGGFDPWSQGPNPTQIMHFAAGIKWNWAPAFLVQWYFVHYEEVSAEGWQIFGLDSLNDIIAEEGGRLLAEDLKGGHNCAGGLIDLDSYFARGRSFLRSQLSESRLQTLALRVHLPNLVVATNAVGGAIVSQPLYAMTIMEQLMAGASDAVVLASPDARVLTLLFHLLRRG